MESVIVKTGILKPADWRTKTNKPFNKKERSSSSVKASSKTCKGDCLGSRPRRTKKSYTCQREFEPSIHFFFGSIFLILGIEIWGPLLIWFQEFVAAPFWQLDPSLVLLLDRWLQTSRNIWCDSFLAWSCNCIPNCCGLACEANCQNLW